jgi:SAM-dependent methyltransferase
MPDQPHDDPVLVDPILGYRRLDPMPDEAELDSFYQSAYVDLGRRGGRFPELGHLLAGGEEANLERAWVQATLHADLLDALDRHLPPPMPRRLVDVGSGLGEFVESASRAGWDAVGLEPSNEASELAASLGRNVIPASLEDYAQTGGQLARPGVVVLTNVLEHVREPILLLERIQAFLLPGGAVVVRVPNDFNPLQQVARTQFGHRPWWIASPDHINYFDHASVRRVLESVRFEVVDQWGDFPMELFLLMGDDYIADPSLGPVCHARRQRFELSLEPGQRRAFGRSLVPLGWGRNSIVVALTRGGG